jgi:ABC-2 type transport system permease protein
MGAAFTLVLPLTFLFVFTLIFGNDPVRELGVTTAQFYAPTLAVFAAVLSTYTDLSIRVSTMRQRGITKRLRATPLPGWLFVAASVVFSCWVAMLAAALMLAVGALAFDVRVYPGTALPGAVVFAVGCLAFSALGILTACLSPSEEATAPIASAILWPLALVSGIFFTPRDTTPAWVESTAALFPLKHFAAAFRRALSPSFAEGTHSAWERWHGHELAILFCWGLAAAILAARLYGREPGGRGWSRRLLQRVPTR